MKQTQTGSIDTVPAPENALLRIEDLQLKFGPVTALASVTMHAQPGEITAIIGDNGAGKSSLTKCILGVYEATHGSIHFNGNQARLATPHDAKRLGIEAVFQDLALFDDLTLWQNMFINREIRKGFGPFSILDKRAMIEKSDELVRGLTVNVPDAKRTVRSMSGGQRQAVAIARAVAWGSELVIMDEPTAALGVRERTEVEDTIIRLRDEGRSFLLISHSFDQVMRVADAVWVMRQGRAVAHRRITDTTGEELVALVTGAQSK
jgi:D-xylose transport system ATP-binding protein